jgi:hypothetical protein
VILLPREVFLPGLIRIVGPGPHRLHFHVKVIGAAIDDEVDLPAVGQKIGLVSDRPGDRRVFDQHLGHRAH